MVSLLAVALLVGLPLLSSASNGNTVSSGSVKASIIAALKQPGAEVGKPAPLFELGDVVKNKSFSIQEVNGKPAMIYFFATWCGSCIAHMPELVALKEKHGENVELVLLDLDATETPEQVREFKDKYYKREDAHWLIDDKRNTVSLKYRVEGTSYAYLVDSQGVLVSSAYSPSNEDVEKQLRLN